RVEAHHHLLEEPRALAPLERLVTLRRALLLGGHVAHHQDERNERRERHQRHREHDRPRRDEERHPNPRQEQHNHQPRNQVRMLPGELEVAFHEFVAAVSTARCNRLSSPLDSSFSMSRSNIMRPACVPRPAMKDASTTPPSSGAALTSDAPRRTTSETLSTT